MSYETATDYEINKRVIEFYYGDDIEIEFDGLQIFTCETEVNDTGRFTLKKYFDPCNNPSDAWPIIIENHINLSKHKGNGEWFAFTRADDLGVSEFQCKNENALRAAIICFLKMKDAEK